MNLIATTLACLMAAPSSFVNWESAHVHPLEITPNGTKLLAVNTADNRLEVLEVSAAGLASIGSVPVGLEPITVRARSDDQAWVVNHISDSISVVDLDTLSVVATIETGDEPTDVVFAGSPVRAFVSVSQLNQIRVFDPKDLTAAPIVVPIAGEDPRALATDGQWVYAAIFEGGNNTTILGHWLVSGEAPPIPSLPSPPLGGGPYPGNPNPPPNSGTEFDPPVAAELPAPPATGLIAKKQPDGTWRDVNGADWSDSVTWDLHDHDVVRVDPQTLDVAYRSGLMNLNMSLAVSPQGTLVVVGTDAINDVRFEPNVKGIFVRMMGALVLAGPGQQSLFDLNPHLDYATPTVPQEVRDLSIGDPRGAVWSSAGDRLYISGMGSNNIIELQPGGTPVPLDVGQGPTGLVVDDANERLYVLNRFDTTISIVDLNAFAEVDRFALFDPTPDTIRQGRPLLYDTHRTSGLGQASCASCHVDAGMDGIAWDLGDPSGDMMPFDQDCMAESGPCTDWHPVKGPMVTQSLKGLAGTEPFHWQGDRAVLEDFRGAFVALQGDDVAPSPAEMQDLAAYIETISLPPNPYRELDGSLSDQLPNGGSAIRGEVLFTATTTVASLANPTCSHCHVPPMGTSPLVVSGPTLAPERQMNVGKLADSYEKIGFDYTSLVNGRGFGFFHDGSVDDAFRDFFNFDTGEFLSAEDEADLFAFAFSMNDNPHPATGTQATIGGIGASLAAMLGELKAIASAGAVGLVAKGRIDGKARGFIYLGGDSYQSDRASETWTQAELDTAASLDTAIVYTMVPLGSETRIGVDADLDGFYDRDELDQCADPRDPASVPGIAPCGNADLDGDGLVGFADLSLLLGRWGQCPPPPADCPPDLTDDGFVDFSDLTILLGNWG